MPTTWVEGGKHVKGVGGGARKKIANSGIIDYWEELQGASVRYNGKETAGTICYYNSQGKLGSGSTKDKKGGYRIDLQGFTSTDPVCANLQLQINENANPSTIACVLVPVNSAFVPSTVSMAFSQSLERVINDTAAWMAQLS